MVKSEPSFLIPVSSIGLSWLFRIANSSIRECSAAVATSPALILGLLAPLVFFLEAILAEGPFGFSEPLSGVVGQDFGMM